jgi:transcriptional regulator with XRE-family HTH domain
MKDRIKKIMQHYGLTAVKFSTETGIQRSALSHVMSGRNKPSLDFVMKILQRYEQLNPKWLLTGKGKMFETATEKPVTVSTEEPLLFDQDEKTESMVKSEEPPVYQTKQNTEKRRQDSSYLPALGAEESDIEQIIIFFRDGSFKSYQQRKNEN